MWRCLLSYVPSLRLSASVLLRSSSCLAASDLLWFSMGLSPAGYTSVYTVLCCVIALIVMSLTFSLMTEAAAHVTICPYHNLLYSGSM